MFSGCHVLLYYNQMALWQADMFEHAGLAVESMD